MQENPDANAVLSGGQGSDEQISEAECMYRQLLMRGIKANRLYKEEKSTTTDENLTFSKKIIDENGLEPAVAIVTNEYHEYRAINTAKRHGIEAYSIPAKTKWSLLPTYYIREVVADMRELVR